MARKRDKLKRRGAGRSRREILRPATNPLFARPALPRGHSQRPSGRCVFCRCTDDRACDDGCCWVDKGHTICSACRPDLKRLPDLEVEALRAPRCDLPGHAAVRDQAVVKAPYWLLSPRPAVPSAEQSGKDLGQPAPHVDHGEHVAAHARTLRRDDETNADPPRLPSLQEQLAGDQRRVLAARRHEGQELIDHLEKHEIINVECERSGAVRNGTAHTRNDLGGFTSEQRLESRLVALAKQQGVILAYLRHIVVRG